MKVADFFSSLVLLGIIYAPPVVLGAEKEKLEGVVRVAGGGFSREIQLVAEGSDKPIVLCEDDTGSRIKKLAAMTVQVNGTWSVNSQGQKTCFAGTDFTIKKHLSGREPLVGILSKSKNVYYVKSDDGKEHKLDEVSTGLAKLAGKKVIIDAKSVSTAHAKGLKVVSYGEHP